MLQRPGAAQSNKAPKRRVRILFFGTSAFAVPSLRAIAKAHDVAGVVTQPDRPSGRGHRLTATPVKAAALDLGLSVFEPPRLTPFINTARALEADAFAVASYGKILPAALLERAPKGALNVHPSLLPLYRGATPLQNVLRDGRTSTGITIFLMDAGMDTGAIVLQEPRAIAPHETFGELHDRLAADSAPLLVRALEQIASGTAQPFSQVGLGDEREIIATLTRPLGTADFELHWDWPADRLENLVRAYAPAPAARAMLGGVRVKVLAARAATHAGRPGAQPGDAIGFEGDAVLVATGHGGALAIERVTPPNRPAQSGTAFMRAVSAPR